MWLKELQLVERQFTSKSRKGYALKVVEKYIRGDITCGISHCVFCTSNERDLGLIQPEQYVILDPMALSRCIDVLDHPNFDISHIIILQSVVEYMQKQNLCSTRQLNRLFSYLKGTKLAKATLFYFPNDIFIDTWTPVDHLSSLERLQQSLIKACSWFQHHAGASGVVLLSEFKWNAIGFDSKLLQQYLQQHPEFDIDPVEVSQPESHYSSDQIKTSNKLVRGKLNVAKHHPNEAFVDDVLIPDTHHMNRALHGDIVYVEVLPESEWKSPVGRYQLINPTNAESISTSGTRVMTGKVVGIAERRIKAIIGTILQYSRTEEYLLAVPMDVRLPKVRLRTKNSAELANQRLLMYIDTWPVDSMYPNGHYTRVLGTAGELETEIESLVLTHEIDDQPFSNAAVACLPEKVCDLVIESSTAKRNHAAPTFCSWKIPQEEIGNRVDLRTSHRIFSVDPDGCQDIDDAMSITTLPNGNIQLGVHIADVTYFVEEDSPLDKEARNRSTSVYLVDRRYDMLPPQLSADLCSLHAKRDRLAVSVLWELSPLDYAVKKVWFGRTVIHSVAALTYTQADEMLSSTYDPAHYPLYEDTDVIHGAGERVEQYKDLAKDLEALVELTKHLHEGRSDGVELSRDAEVGFDVDFNLSVKKKVKVCDTVAELMIFANSAVAKRIADRFPHVALLRKHEVPSADRFDELIQLAKAKNIHIDPNHLEFSCPDKEINSVLKTLATYAMTEAEYISGVAGRDIRHYGLGLDYYTHFTSPIRRYADIIVHRLLLRPRKSKTRAIASVQQVKITLPMSETPSILDTDDLSSDTIDIEQEIAPDVEEIRGYDRLCKHINIRHRNAKDVSRDCTRLFLAFYFRNRSEIATGVITGLRRNGFLVYVPEFDIKAPVYLMDHQDMVHMDPSLLRVAENQTISATGGFVSAPNRTRAIPQATIRLESDSKLIFSSATGQLEFTVMDQVQVVINCPDFDSVSARIPNIKVHFSSLKADRINVEPATDRLIETVVHENNKTKVATKSCAVKKDNILTTRLCLTLEDIDSSIEEKISKKSPKRRKFQNCKGRIRFGGFDPPVVKPQSKYGRLMTQQYDESQYSAVQEVKSYDTTSKLTTATVNKYKIDAQKRMFKLKNEKRHDKINRQRKAEKK